MADAYECDNCLATFVGKPREMSDLAVPGTPFTMRFTFGVKRPKEDQEAIRAAVTANPLMKMLGQQLVGQEVDEDAVANASADLCDPCLAKLLRQAVELSGLDLHG